MFTWAPPSMRYQADVALATVAVTSSVSVLKMPPLGENFTTGSSEEISICLALEPPSYSKYVSSVIPLMSGVCPLPLLKITFTASTSAKVE